MFDDVTPAGLRMQRMDILDTFDAPCGTGKRMSRRRVLGTFGDALGGVLGGAIAGVGVAGPAWALPAHEVRSWPAGKPVPALNLVDLDEQAWTLARLRGRAVVLNFWATWCDPCRSEMPSLQRLADRGERDGLVVLAVNYKEPRPAIRRFLQSNSLALPVLLDPDGQATALWTPKVFPTTVLIGRDGAPRCSVVGELDWGGTVAGELLKPLMASPRRV